MSTYIFCSRFLNIVDYLMSLCSISVLNTVVHKQVKENHEVNETRGLAHSTNES